MGVAELDYINPEIREDVLLTTGFTALYLPIGTKDASALHTSSAAFHVIRRSGMTVNGETIRWGPKDTFTTPVFADIIHRADEDAFLVRIHDRPLQERPGYYEERMR